MSDDTVRSPAWPPQATGQWNGRRRTFWVVALTDEFSGALAYALEQALRDPATIRVVHVRAPSCARATVPVREDRLHGDPLTKLEQLGDRSDLMIVQSPSSIEGRQLLADLRQKTASLLVEVDDAGGLRRVSGAECDFYAASVGQHTVGAGPRR